MRLHLACLILLGFLPFATPAHAALSPWIGPERASGASYGSITPWGRHYTRHHAYAHQRSRQSRYRHRQYQTARHGLPGPCYLAARQGGPCGCVAQGHIFGRFDRLLNGMNLWLARTWLGFPRTSPAPGMAAVWGIHHVEAIVATNGDGTITTSGPYGQRRVRTVSVTIVDPHGGYVGGREGRRHYVYRRHWHHRHYARASRRRCC